ncbi:hypothetical protein [Capnocytophaga canis]|uniref:hypothetical protein n=1 Tax=Capnocytophaga canis TaxID=1848903 RepID=UPI0037D7A59E
MNPEFVTAPIFDANNDEINAFSTLSFDERVTGWTSFYSFAPDWMVGLNNRFFSIKEGQLFIHNEEDELRNTFYGNHYPSVVTLIFNDAPSEDKLFNALMLDGNKTWHTQLKTNLTESNIFSDEYQKKESRWFAYTRANENNNDLTGFNAIGIGVINEVTGNQVIITGGYIAENIGINDLIFQMNGQEQELIGTITNITENQIEITPNGANIIVNSFCFATKNTRLEGANMRGYYMETTLTNTDTSPVELFSVECNVSKSYV